MDQVLTIIWLRFKLISYKLRTLSGIANLISTVMLFIAGAGLSLGMAFGFGALTFFASQSADELLLQVSLYVIFYVLLLFGILVPLLLATGNPGFESIRFLQFPISHKKLYGITLSACFGNPEHLFYYPTLITLFSVGFFAFGAKTWIGLIILLFILFFHVVWNHTLVLIFQRIMRKRRMREIVVLIAFMLFIFLSLMPALSELLVEKFKGKDISHLTSILPVLAKIGKIFPPSMAAEGLFALHQNDIVASLLNAMGLLVWISLGVALGYHMYIHYHLGDKGKIQKRKIEMKGERLSIVPSKLHFLESLALSFLPIEILAVVSKDLRYLFRSVLGKFNFFMMPVFVMIVVFIIGRMLKQPFLGMEPGDLLLYGMLLYVILFSNNMMNNAFAWEGNGVRSYFLNPTLPRSILIGKNLAIWLYNFLLFIICIVIWSVLVQVPSPFTLLTAILLFNIALLTFTTAGNFISILFPVRRDMSTIRNQPSQVGILLSLFSFSVIVGIIAFSLFIPLFLGMKFLQLIFLAALMIIQIGIYALTLRLSSRLMDERKEKMIEALKEKS